MTSQLVRLELKEGLGRHLRAGHPWVFRRGLLQTPKLPPGSVVDLTEDGKFMARGYYDPLSAIAVRVLTRDPKETIDQAFFDRKLSTAAALRSQLADLAGTDSYRLVHGEGDGLPGIVVDLYAGSAVLKLYSAGLTPYRSMIVQSLSKLPGVKGVVGRDEVPRDDEPDEEKGAGKMLFGAQAPETIAISEHGVKFKVDVWTGQKTGFFLDQRENRRLIGRIAKGHSVLNAFCFSGGFSVNAALGGATSVLSVDQDADAIALARENFTLNGLDPNQHEFLAADVFTLFRRLEKEGRTFSMIILDPPAFAKSQKAVEQALDGYASLNRQALALLAPGGILATASCSARVTAEQFKDAVGQAAHKAGVDLQLVEERYQSPDHPIRLEFPEGRYLKFLVLRAL
ncbi:MAG: class I SAM-dependent rRNA methyltransferase [Myxococcaceae bacterium]